MHTTFLLCNMVARYLNSEHFIYLSRLMNCPSQLECGTYLSVDIFYVLEIQHSIHVNRNIFSQLHKTKTNNNETNMILVPFTGRFNWNMKITNGICVVYYKYSQITRKYFLWCSFSIIHNSIGNWRVLQRIEHIMSIRKKGDDMNCE